MKNHFHGYYTFPSRGKYLLKQFLSTYLDLLQFVVCLTFVYNEKDIKTDV